ncbi:MAG TPA: ribonuclease H-like YkuK family protein [Candidatus Nitrosocosmicus sp.]|nr:ribonuclease H-like YkuK family protein [Candidatus Nitrosocosmicus sp.]
MYTSPTYGQLKIEEVQQKVSEFMSQNKTATYKVIVGSDSQKIKGNGYDFVNALVIHRVGHGGIYFWKRNIVDQKMSLKERMYREALLSIQSAEDIFSLFKTNGISKYNIEIHVDIGRNGETREMIQELVGMVRGNGYDVKIKPDSFGASKVADRHT